jgi:TatD DNase family protein
MILVDSHCHLNLLDPSLKVDAVLARAKQQEVSYFLNVCVSIAEFSALLHTAQSYLDVWASVGLHPNEQQEEIDADSLILLAAHEKVIAIGETGLDYFRSQGDLSWQKQRFRTHIVAAKKIRKPLVVHTRQAKEDTLAIMREENCSEIGGVMHCFSEDWDMAKSALDMNFYISLSGTVTFKNAHQLQEVAKLIPLDRLLIETDSPYLAPQAVRGKKNEPAYLRHTAEYLAELRGISLEHLAAQTTENFFTLFKGAKPSHV